MVPTESVSAQVMSLSICVVTYEELELTIGSQVMY